MRPNNTRIKLPELFCDQLCKEFCAAIGIAVLHATVGLLPTSLVVQVGQSARSVRLCVCLCVQTVTFEVNSISSVVT